MDHRLQIDCESLLGLGRHSLLVSGADHRGRVRLSPSAHIHPVGSVAVLLNLDTTPVQLRTTPIQTADPTRRGILRTFAGEPVVVIVSSPHIPATAITAAGLIAAPAANAQAHTVTYTLWVDNPAPNGFSVSYVANEPVDQQSPTRGGDPNLFLSPGEIWTRETTMDDPTQWAYMVAVYKYANANPVGTHCEIRVDGVVEATGVSVCSIRQLQAGSGPPGTM